MSAYACALVYQGKLGCVYSLRPLPDIVNHENYSIQQFEVFVFILSSEYTMAIKISSKYFGQSQFLPAAFCINIIYLYYELHFISPPNSYVQLKPLGPSSVTRFEDGASKLVISFKMRLLMCGQSQSNQCSIKKK